MSSKKQLEEKGGSSGRSEGSWLAMTWVPAVKFRGTGMRWSTPCRFAAESHAERSRSELSNGKEQTNAHVIGETAAALSLLWGAVHLYVAIALNVRCTGRSRPGGAVYELRLLCGS